MILPVTCSINLEFDKEKVWSIISKPGHLNEVHPFCKSNKVIIWPGKKSIDKLVYLNGLTYKREFYSWEKSKGYSLFIGEKEKEQSYVVWEIFDINESNYLKITVYPYILRDMPKLISYLPYKFIVIPTLESYLKSVIRGVNYYLTTKNKTPKNYFGYHKWFS